MNYTDEQIIKALECCSYATYNSDCEKCPYYPDKECVKKQCTDIIDLIKRLKAENERLNSLCTSKDVIINDLNAKNAEIKVFYGANTTSLCLKMQKKL